jgi:hypothetical protein
VSHRYHSADFLISDQRLRNGFPTHQSGKLAGYPAQGNNEGGKEPGDKLEGAGKEQGEFLGVLGSYGLGGGFTEYEEEDGQADSGNEDTVLSPHIYRQSRGDSRGGGIDQGIAEQDGGEELFRMFNQPGNPPGTSDFVINQMLYSDPL